MVHYETRFSLQKRQTKRPQFKKINKKESYLSFDKSCLFQSGQPDSSQIHHRLISHIEFCCSAHSLLQCLMKLSPQSVQRERSSFKWLWCRSEIHLHCVKEEPSPKMPAAWSAILLYCFFSNRLSTIVSCWEQKQFSVLKKQVKSRLTQHCT